ncbi:PREDICTED: anthocyanidin reductase ((2S)-flavan-3-ol-forming) isoform X1 [Ipomoea nil]|uniref:anthocyanidin reductase ((2S)-flavan-3-ol-forming) isoform X1 n=1 Tax=Ipomoea nil TaxID=35883 RepID=UPI000900DFFB|nr:PREDICTED: anthocyanidin reductase ((2S)-flavan-3-ol-forming) isoform X1 [Ipomoea nil]
MEDSGGDGTAMRDSKTYCVTGGSGFIGSWLIKSLLRRGYGVHATVRHPEKALHLLKLSERLKLFKADLQEEGSFDEAIRSCDGVFHVAASMEFGVEPNHNIDSYVQENVIDPAAKGTINVLKSCLKANSVKRVIFTSSISTMTAKDSSGKWRPVVDESCNIPTEHVWHTKPSGWVYALSKVFTEKAAIRFANENGIDLVSIITPTVAGPFLTPTVPSSIRMLLSLITGDVKLLPILAAVNSRMGSIALVHIEDICSAHIFLMENARAEGRYMCCTHNCSISELIAQLSQEYPVPTTHSLMMEKHDSQPPVISSKKLRDLGYSFKYSVQDIIHDTLQSCKQQGFLSHTQYSDDCLHRW